MLEEFTLPVIWNSAANIILVVVSGIAINWASQALFPTASKAAVSLRNGWRGYRFSRATNDLSVARYISEKPESALGAGLIKLTQLVFFGVLIVNHKPTEIDWPMYVVFNNLVYPTWLWLVSMESCFTGMRWFRAYSDPIEFHEAALARLNRLGVSEQNGSEWVQIEPIETQIQMNDNASADLHEVNLKLNEAIASALELMHREEKDNFQRSQKAWEKCRDLEEKNAGSVYVEGTIFPLVKASALTELSRQRLSHVLGILEDLRVRC